MQNLAGLSLLAFALTFAGSSFTVAHAQVLQSDGTMSQPQQPEAPMKKAPNAAHQAKHLSRQLGLTQDQSAKLLPILTDRDTRMAALHNDATIDPKTMHKQGHAIVLDTEGKINALLTPDQQKMYADMRAARHHGGKDVPPAAA